MRGLTAIANALRIEGTEFLFCFPANPLIEAAAIAGIAPIMSRTERATINMADGYSRVSSGRNIGVCATQGGPGIENAFGGVAHAFAESVPLLVLPGGPARARTAQPPEFDPVENYRGITKWTAQINQAERVPEMMRRAYTAMRSGRAGPVLLQVPSDVGMEEFADEAFDYEPVAPMKSAGNPSDVAAAARALLAARNPVIIAGQGVLWANASEELREFAELTNAPVMTTNPGKSAFPENHPLALGAGGGTMTKMVRHFLDKSDLIFGIGTSFTTNLASTRVPAGRTLVQCTVDARDLNKEHRIHQAVVGDAALVLSQLIQEVQKQEGANGRRGDSRVSTEIAQVKAEWQEQWMPLWTSDETPINPYRIMWDVMNLVDRTQTIVTHDSGHPRDQLIPLWESLVPHGYLGWGNSSQLGYGMGIAMGAKLAAPEKTVINFMGDAAIGMAGMDIETAARHKLGTLTIVLNNHVLSGYSVNYPTAAEKFGFTNLYGDYSALAKSLGAYSEKIDSPQEIVPAVGRAQAAIASGQPAVLEFMTKEENRLSRYPAP